MSATAARKSTRYAFPLVTRSRNPFTLTLVNLLLTMKDGETWTYDRVSNALGMTRNQWTKVLGPARKILRRDHAFRLETVTKVGLRRMPANETPKVVEQSAKAANRRARRDIEILCTVTSQEYSALTAKEQIEHNAAQAHAGTLAYITTPHVQRAIGEAAAVANGKLALGTTLDVIRER